MEDDLKPLAIRTPIAGLGGPWRIAMPLALVVKLNMLQVLLVQTRIRDDLALRHTPLLGSTHGGPTDVRTEPPSR